MIFAVKEVEVKIKKNKKTIASTSTATKVSPPSDSSAEYMCERRGAKVNTNGSREQAKDFKT